MALTKKPLTLSLIIPAYNEARHLMACLDAVAAQTEAPDEVLVIDNNSTDDTAKIAKSYPFVTLVNEKRQGILFARNTGFDRATGYIIGRIDADTIIPEGWVHYVKRFYGDPKHVDNALTGGGYFYNVVFPPRKIGGWMHSQVALRFNRFLMGHYILWGSNMAITAGQWQRVRGDVCMRTDIHEDLDLAIHLHRLGYEITYRAGLRVGVIMRRVFADRQALHENMMWWPRSLKAHDNPRWVMGWIGAHALFFGSYLLWPINLAIKKVRRLPEF